MPTRRPVKRLFDLEIDEVSLVDKPANQFGKVAFSKRAEDGMPQLFDLDGNEVGEDELEHGETVTDESGNEFVFLEEGSPEYDELAADADDGYDDGYEDDDDFDDVGKASAESLRQGYKGLRRGLRGEASLARPGFERASGRGNRAGQRLRGVGQRGQAASDRARGAGRSAYGSTASTRRRAAEGGQRAGRRAQLAGLRGTMQARGAIGRRPLAAVAGAGGAGAAGGYGYERTRKSFGGEIYDELSKALTQTDRDEAIAKALDVVNELADQNEELYDIVGKMADEKALSDFAGLAQEYGPLPVHPARLGAIMKRAADTLPAGDVEILDRLFSSVGEQLYDEVGKGGTGASVEVYDQVSALANDVVAKSDMTPEQAITAIFSENPDAYDEYLAETATR